jgi:hypothetical protein
MCWFYLSSAISSSTVYLLHYLRPTATVMAKPKKATADELDAHATTFTSLPCAQDTGGENPCNNTKDVLKLLVVGDSAVRLLITLGARSAW